jgi:hypothetical protein
VSNTYPHETDICRDDIPREKGGAIDWQLAKGRSWDCPECSGNGLTQRWGREVYCSQPERDLMAIACYCHRCVMGRAVRQAHVENQKNNISNHVLDLADEQLAVLRDLALSVRPSHREAVDNHKTLGATRYERHRTPTVPEMRETGRREDRQHEDTRSRVDSVQALPNRRANGGDQRRDSQSVEPPNREVIEKLTPRGPTRVEINAMFTKDEQVP